MTVITISLQCGFFFRQTNCIYQIGCTTNKESMKRDERYNYVHGDNIAVKITIQS